MINLVFKYFSYSSLGSITGLITVLYLTRVLSPEDFAYLGMMQVFIYVFVPLVGMQSFGLLGVYKSKNSRDNYLIFRNTYFNLSLFLYFILGGGVLLFTIFFFSDYFFLITFFVLISFNRFFTAFHNVELIQDMKASIFGGLNLSMQIVLLIFTYFILSYIEMSWIGRLASVLLVESIFVVIKLIFFSDILRDYSLTISRRNIKDIFLFGCPLFLVLFASWVNFESDKIVVGYFFTLEVVGLYSVAYMLSAFIGSINVSVLNSFVSKFRSLLSRNEGRGYIRKSQQLYTFFILIVAASISLVFYGFEEVILGEEYAGVWKILTCVLFSYSFFGIYSFCGVVLEFYKLSVKKAGVVVLSSVINIMMTLLLLDFLEILAPAVGTLIGFFFMAVLSIFTVSKELNSRGVAQ